MTLFSGVVLILCTIMLVIVAVRQHEKVSKDSPYDDTNRQIDFEDFYQKLRKFVSNEQEKIYAVLGIKNAYHLLESGIQEEGFCILTDKAAYFIGKVHQKKWIFAFRTNVQHRIIASELKGINVGTLSQFRVLLLAALSLLVEIANLRCIYRITTYASSHAMEEAGPVVVVLGMIAAIVAGFLLLIYFVLHAFLLKRTNICIEFTSLTVAFMASELGKQEIKDFYKAVSEVQELYVNIVNPVPVERPVNPVRQSANVYSDKVTSLSELSKLYENGIRQICICLMTLQEAAERRKRIPTDLL